MDKEKGTLEVTLEASTTTTGPLTKRKMIFAINNVYDILGWCAPVTIVTKLLFGDRLPP